MRNNMLTIALTAGLALALTACGPEPTTSEPATVTKTTTEPAPAPEPTTEEAAAPEETPEETLEETPEAASDLTIPYGETFEWEDGVKALLSEPVAYQPTEYAAGGEDYEHKVAFKVTLVNGSDQVLDASFTTPNVLSGEREGDAIFDDVAGGSPLTSLLPGRTATFQVAYGVDDPDDVVAEFAPSWDHDYAYWSN